ncbi:MAG: hypothetical protein GKS02_14255 [Alphaproteobacteria bacterium]|nr:hypothetical protein [Alphaproteobacteria bacterium]
MQINNQFSPASLGQGARPDHAGNGQGRGQQFQTVTSDVEPATTTDTTTAVAPTEEGGETEGPGKSGNSPAHRARTEFDGFGEGENFGWLVSQIARGLISVAPTPDGEGEGDTGVIADDVGTDVVVDGDETPPTGEDSVPGDETADTGGVADPVVEDDPLAGLLDALADDGTTSEATTDPVADLLDELLDDETEVT